MSQAFRSNIAAVVGLALLFPGAWMVFGLGPALMAIGWLIWFTAVYSLHLVAARARAAG